MSFGIFAEAYEYSSNGCVVSAKDIESLTALHAQSLENYFVWLENKSKEIIYPELDGKFKPWAGREIGTSYLNQEDNYLFDYVEFVQLADGCDFHSNLGADDANIKKIILLRSSVYRDDNGAYVTSTPKLKY